MTGKTIEEQLNESALLLVQNSEEDLVLELGKRLSRTSEEIFVRGTLSTSRSIGNLSTDEDKSQMLPGTARQIGHRFLENVNAQMYKLICGADDADNKKIRDAAAAGVQDLSFVLSGIFVATFGWLPGIASVVGVIVAKRFARAAYDAVCKTWKEQLR